MGWPPQSAVEIARFLSDRRTYVDGSSRDSVEYLWPITPREYLSFARTDLGKSKRQRVNALGNGKRALHAQTDAILHCAGLLQGVAAQRWNFPKRLAVLAELGIATPAILTRINRHRNEVEHDFAEPGNADSVGDLLDVVELFLSATGPFARGAYSHLEFGRPFRGGQRGIGLYRRGGELEVRAYPGGEILRLAPCNNDRLVLVPAAYKKAISEDFFP